MIDPRFAEAHLNGDIHIHDLDFYAMTTTCCQIDVKSLLQKGFSTGHGSLREPQTIGSAAALACIAIQSNQNDQHGGQSIPNFDYGLAPYVEKSFRKNYMKALIDAFEGALVGKNALHHVANGVKFVFESLESDGAVLSVDEDACVKFCRTEEFDNLVATVGHYEISREEVATLRNVAWNNATRQTFLDTYQAMEALIHNLNTMHSRAGAQVPFSSINYGTDTSVAGRMVTECVLLALNAGLGNGETPIFPIHIFRVKEGVNFNAGDKNYDLFKLACRVSAKRLFPNFSFQDAPFNLKYYREGRPETEVSYMGCRTRVIGNVHDPDNEIAYSRGNLSFTSINLPRLAIDFIANRVVAATPEDARQIFAEDMKLQKKFVGEVLQKLDLCVEQLLERFGYQSARTARNFPFLIQQGCWLGGDKLKLDEEVGEVLKHGTLSVGFIGLAETLTALFGRHHGESIESQAFGLYLVTEMRKALDERSRKTKLNFTLLATPAEGLSGRFVKLDRKRYGEIKGVTDKEFYTNSFHIPVDYPITINGKIALEAPYHELTNAGHITYVEVDGAISENPQAFEKIVRRMKELGVGYGAVNHPVDRDPVCGYDGVISGDVCPNCGREETRDQPFERIRRITGYLVGTLDRFNDAKLAEVNRRVTHSHLARQDDNGVAGSAE
jgi:ribonucleoside-triphosphate reductase